MAEPQKDVATPTPDDNYKTSEATLRLLVGLTLEAIDTLDVHLRDWEQQLALNLAETPATQTATNDEATLNDADRLRYALIGFAFAARQRLADDLTSWILFPDRATKQMIRTTDKLAKNPFLRPFLKPIVEQAEQLSTQAHNEVERWIRIGQTEEVGSRVVSRIAITEIVEEVLAALSENPQLQDLVQQQSVGLAEEVVDSVRGVTVTADIVVENIVQRLLRRQPKQPLLPTDDRYTQDQANGHREVQTHEPD